MDFRKRLREGILYLDGGTGSILQSLGLKPGELPEVWNIERANDIVNVARQYYEAGSNVVYTNTFGANSLKYDGRDGRYSVEEIVSAAVNNTRRALNEAKGDKSDRYVALDIGPLGKMLSPLGDLPFEEAVEIFANTVRAGVKAGADLIAIETMNDSYETKAAVLAAKENSDLPVIVTNVYDEEAKLMTGACPESMVAMLEGLGVDALGANCSLGPKQMIPIAKRLYEATSLPLIMKPNAGLPKSVDGKTVFDVDAKEFSDIMTELVSLGARILGGCCGTTPEYIKETVKATKNLPICDIIYRNLTVVSSSQEAVYFDKKTILIGERINPTGKKLFKEALRNHDIGYVLNEGIKQKENGAHVLDVNVGLPEIDEPKLLTECVEELQSVISLPLQIDTTNVNAMESALRVYNGKAMINSVNGKEEVMNEIFPLAKKYGGLVVCLTLDEDGIPDSAQRRIEIAEKIINRAKDFGIDKKDLIFDPLAMAISSDSSQALVTLDAVKMLTDKLHVKTSLGVSNVSFGLPNREFITASFFTMAMQNGLSGAIMNPFSVEMMKAYYGFNALSMLDDNCSEYIDFAGSIEQNTGVLNKTDKSGIVSDENGLKGAIIKGLKEEAAVLCKKALETADGLTLINEEIVPALDVVGVGFEKKTMFLPQLLMSAEAAKAAFDEVKKTISASEANKETVILATVKGDIHDIGKNIVKVIMENYGYKVIDLGKDVPPETIANCAIENNIRLVGLSALMTTTVPAMEETIKLISKLKPDCKVVVGGAVLTQEYADMIHADKYAKNAMETVRYAEELFNY
ncbi:MAG: homocysteine S-methyltransferase family protein [Lachnospiraceae bacterium]|nr:homocysteine S-methyltransferase family protein [Lachnospiraceae bacterium]MDY5640469.1 homocysteine S-methyltransferase family protein [Lachnospiraceae bacterium]